MTKHIGHKQKENGLNELYCVNINQESNSKQFLKQTVFYLRWWLQLSKMLAFLAEGAIFMPYWCSISYFPIFSNFLHAKISGEIFHNFGILQLILDNKVINTVVKKSSTDNNFFHDFHSYYMFLFELNFVLNS
jgi:hypothetical protein